MERAIEDIEFLSSSRTRVNILKILNERGQLSNHELREQANSSRTTVQRNLESLVERGWVQNTNRTYELTLPGETVADRFIELVETVQTENRLQPFLTWVDRSDLNLDIELLADAELLVAEPGNPWSMINRHVECLKGMDHCRGFLPFTGLHASEAGHERVVNHGAESELVVTPEIADIHFSNSAYKELTEEMVETGRSDYFVYDGELPYCLVLIDGIAQVVVADGDEPRAMLETDSEEVIDWAENKYESYKQQSEKVT